MNRKIKNKIINKNKKMNNKIKMMKQIIQNKKHKFYYKILN